MKSLSEISVGTTVKVKSISKDSSVKRRLLEMGIVPGIEVLVRGKAPLGDPIEIVLRGYKLTLRKEEAASILVE
ncbi:ferrous iron transport protein A [Tissierella sp. MSJ-40]|uniref:Ferrous iron transport protein A n=1 Tax=Tissierella simiarum TaxID=2841534 RepID=A0ABS6E2Y8_9FIRM|nr:FeoA family protein [Tissierella simiarum]MBU5437186.1 ferrous iron transport protein A [Tissierella simiarum]